MIISSKSLQVEIVQLGEISSSDLPVCHETLVGLRLFYMINDTLAIPAGRSFSSLPQFSDITAAEQRALQLSQWPSVALALGFLPHPYLNLKSSQKLSQESAAVCKCRLPSVRPLVGWESVDMCQHPTNCSIEIKFKEIKELGDPNYWGAWPAVFTVSRKLHAQANQSAHTCTCRTLCENVWKSVL